MTTLNGFRIKVITNASKQCSSLTITDTSNKAWLLGLTDGATWSAEGADGTDTLDATGVGGAGQVNFQASHVSGGSSITGTIGYYDSTTNGGTAGCFVVGTVAPS